jgi:hypothetical protein
MPLGLALGLPFTRPRGGSTAPSYVRTAFVNYDNGFNSALNNPENPYGRFDEAIDALTAAYPGEDVTVVLQSNYTGTIDPSTALASALTGAGSLTFKSDDAGPWTITALNIGYVENADLRLDDITITTLSWADSISSTNPSAGSITGSNAPTIGTLNLPVQSQSPVYPGDSGSNVTGNNGANGSDSEPDVSGPTNGSDGESANADGGGGQSQTGNSAWDIALFGSGLISQLNGSGENANGANGGGGGTATGGNGGNGGSSLSTEYSENGANGGNGGNASANGGSGGSGQGGNGSQVYKETGWTITSSELSAGTATGGSGGNAGTAIAGSGGSKGYGALGGSDGSDGAAGSASNSSGAPGIATDGISGGIINI